MFHHRWSEKMRSILIISAIGLIALLTHAQPASAGPLTNPAGLDALNYALNQNALMDSAIVRETAYRGGRHYRRNRGHNYRRHARRNYRYDRRHYRRNYRRHSRSYGFGIDIYPYFTPAPLYAVPVPIPVYPGGACTYWSQRCHENWSRRSDYLGCMRYQGCY
jgi:hypothetical protein